MAKIETYTTVTPTINDKIIGTDVSDNNETKNFLISDVLGLSTEVTTILETTVDLSVAQIADLHNTAVTLIDAPGAGKFINVEKVYQWVDFQTTPWSAGGINSTELYIGNRIAVCDIAFEQTNSTDIAILSVIQSNFFIQPNTALTIFADDAFTGGDSPAKIYIKYSIVTLT